MRIDTANLIAMKSELQEMVKNLELGDILRGRIVEALENSISIRTASGQIFTAALQKGVELQKGAFVELIVKDISEGQIFAEIKRDCNPPAFDAKVSRVLKELSLPVDEKTMQAVKMLFKYNLPMNKDTIVKIMNLQNNIESLKQSREGKVGLMLSGLDIKSTPVEVLNKTALLSEPEIIKALELYEPAAEVTLIDNNGDKASVTSEVTENIHFEENIKSGPLAAGKNSDSRAEQPQQNEKSGKIQPEIKAEISEVNISKFNVQESEALGILDRLGAELDIEPKQYVVQAEKLLQVLRDTDMEDLAFLMSKEMEITPGNIGLLIRHKNNEDKVFDFLDKLQKQIEGNEGPQHKDIRESIMKVFLRPGELEEAEQIKEKYRELIKLGERTEKLLNGNSLSNTDIRETLSNLRDNIEFIKNINQFTNYLQIPLIINSRRDTAKLYVFREGKRGRTVDPHNANILLALDLRYSGHVESLISVEGRSVGITFRIEDKKTGELIKGKAEDLKSSLEAKGYSMKPVKVINLEEPFNLLALEGVINENNKDRMHFDERI